MLLAVKFRLWLAMAAVMAPNVFAAVGHPSRVDEQTNCLECHAAYATGAYVHPAVALGCPACHSIENRDDMSRVALKPSESVLCFKCHQRESHRYTHYFYAAGDCLRCHDPHRSANPRLLKAGVNELCLQCHLQGPGDVSSRHMPTIILTDDNQRGHPFTRHPVGGIADPLRNEQMSCLSCHQAHGGGKLHLLKMGAEIPEDAINKNTETKDLCSQCHMRLWGLDPDAGKKSKKNRGRGK